MNRRYFIAGSIAAASGAILVAEGCGGKNVLSGGGSSAQYTLDVNYANSTVGGYRMRTRTYNGGTLGPILETTPGSTLSIRVVNNLPPNPKVSVPAGVVRIPAVKSMMEAMDRRPKATRDATVIDPMNNPHDFNTTNLHVHGVQTVPHLFDPIGTSNPQAMMLNIMPGSSFTYDFPIPADHPSGLFWFHPHHHGSTDVQVSGGMAGLIVVRGAIDKVPEIAAAREIFMVVQTLNVNQSTSDPSLYEYEPVAYQTPQNGGYNLGTDYTMLTVNGTGVNWANNNTNAYQQLSVPQFSAKPGEIVRLRLLNGTNFLFLPLVFPGLEVYQIAFDGVNFAAPAAGTYDYTGTVTQANMFQVNVMMTSPGNRMELLVRMPETPGTYTISSAATGDVAFQGFPKYDLAQFVVSGSPVQMSIPASLPLPEREYPIISDGEIVARRTVTYTEGPDSTLLTGFGFYIDGKLYDEMATPLMPKSGTAEEWTIVNKTTESHPFHIHVNSFQLTHINGVSVGTPQVWDTFLVPPQANGTDGSITLRIRFKEFKGKTVHHCHVLPHEDTGMMQNLLIT
jgi:FtsP/CotA-like multicopper oxidase with cupredoxin domain